MRYVEYAIFDKGGRSIFGASYRSISDALTDVVQCFDTEYSPHHVYRPLFPVTIQGLTRSDIYEPIMTITYDITE